MDRQGLRLWASRRAAPCKAGASGAGRSLSTAHSGIARPGVNPRLRCQGIEKIEKCSTQESLWKPAIERPRRGSTPALIAQQMPGLDIVAATLRNGGDLARPSLVSRDPLNNSSTSGRGRRPRRGAGTEPGTRASIYLLGVAAPLAETRAPPTHGCVAPSDARRFATERWFRDSVPSWTGALRGEVRFRPGFTGSHFSQ